MSPTYLWYQVQPHEHLPEGMAAVTFTVLSPIWQGGKITLVFPDGWVQTLSGHSATGQPCDLRVFWTEAAVGGPPVCLAIGGDGGVRVLEQPGDSLQTEPVSSIRPFLALATALIPAPVLAVIGPEPARSPHLLG